jgi:hypothetical protein
VGRCGGCVLDLERGVVEIAVPPVLARFIRSDQWVDGEFEVSGAVPAGRVVTAADVTAQLAGAEVHPVSLSRGHALGAALLRPGSRQCLVVGRNMFTWM